MATIESDWPAEIALDIVTPLVYLKTQASALRQLTRGVVEARVLTTCDNDDSGPLGFVHALVLIVPALDEAEVEILAVGHELDLVYPCWLTSYALTRDGSLAGEQRQKNTFEELRSSVRAILQAPETTGRIQSLIARCQEAQIKVKNGQ